MVKPLDRHRRDSTLFQLTGKLLRDFVGPNHPLLQVEGQRGFAGPVAPLEERYCPGYGLPAIHPEVIVQALLVCQRYNRCSFRTLYSATSENAAYEPVSGP